MKVVVTGQVGLDKKPVLRTLVELARSEGQDVALCNIGDMMYAEAPDVGPGKILNLPLSRLNNLRRSVFKDVLNAARTRANVVVNTHSTFRWHHGLFYAFDHDQMNELGADLYIVLVDNVDRIHYRLSRDGHVDHALKDLMVWREEEVLATELLSRIVRGHGRFYILSRGADDEGRETAQTIARLMFHPDLPKAYLSFPMSHVGDSPELQAEIDAFREEMKKHLICFDPGDVEEKYLCKYVLEAVEKGQRTIRVGPAGAEARMETSQVVEILPDIDGQIYARDFMLIDQSDMIISLVPELPGGRPGLSSGVERELQHAHEATKDVFVIWMPECEPSPFITETASRVFRGVEEAIRFFVERSSSTEGKGLFA